MKLKAVVVALALAVVPALPAAAHTEIFAAALNGPSEAPPNASLGTGTALVTLDLDLVTMKVEALFFGLDGITTLSHIHCCTTVANAGTAGVATVTPSFTDFPLGVTFGSYTHTFDMTLASSYNPAFITANGGTVSGALNAFVLGMEAGKTYLNIHTDLVPAGEIRGFLHAVPEPETYLLMLAGLAMVGWMRARRRKH